MKRYLRILILTTVVISVVFPASLFAQGDGARFYWKGLVGTNAVPVIATSLGGNANPFDPSNRVIPGANFEASMSMAGFAKMIPLAKRSALVSVIVPMGRISSDISINNSLNKNTTARGFGDPMFLVDFNLIGPKAIMNIPDMLRYKPGFSVDIIGSLAIPVGEYDPASPINIGQNRWYGRIGAPVICQIGPWVPGKRTTLEFLPAVWFYGANDDFVGKKMETAPMIQLEAHLTHDFMERFWGSIDLISYSGGKATIDGVEGNALSNIGLGGTLGYHINDNMQLNASYSTTVNDKAAEDLKMDGFRFTLIYGWHPLVEGMRRLKGNE